MLGGCLSWWQSPEVDWLFVQRFRISRNPPMGMDGVFVSVGPAKPTRFEWIYNEKSLFSSQIFYASSDSNEKKIAVVGQREDFRDKMFTILTFSSPHVGHLTAREPPGCWCIRGFGVILTILALDRLFPEKHQSLPPWPEGGPARLIRCHGFGANVPEILGSFVWAQQKDVSISYAFYRMMLEYCSNMDNNIRGCIFLARCFNHGEAPNV